MKSIKLSILLLLLIAVFACKKTANTSSGNSNVSTDEAADIVSSSFSLNSGGVVTASNDATNVATSLSASLTSTASSAPSGTVNTNENFAVSRAAINSKKLECGVTKSDTITRNGSVGSSITYSYNAIYSFTLNCNGLVPDSLTSSSTFSGTYSGPLISSVFTGTHNFSVTGLPASSTNLVLNGTYTRNGSFQSKKDTSNKGTHSVSITVKNLTVAKSGRTIVSGTATFTITGETVKKGSWTYNGTITFNNDSTGSLTLGGVKYKINLLTGIYVRL